MPHWILYEAVLVLHFYLNYYNPLWVINITHIAVEPLRPWPNNPRGTLLFLGVKAPWMCLTLPASEYFLCWAQHRNPSEVYDSRLHCVIQSWSVQYGKQQKQQQHQLVASVKRQRLTNGTPALEPLSESAFQTTVWAIGAVPQVQPQGPPAH